MLTRWHLRRTEIRTAGHGAAISVRHQRPEHLERRANSLVGPPLFVVLFVVAGRATL
jgi:hypothetical protein